MEFVEFMQKIGELQILAGSAIDMLPSDLDKSVQQDLMTYTPEEAAQFLNEAIKEIEKTGTVETVNTVVKRHLPMHRFAGNCCKKAPTYAQICGKKPVFIDRVRISDDFFTQSEFHDLALHTVSADGTHNPEEIVTRTGVKTNRVLDTLTSPMLVTIPFTNVKPLTEGSTTHAAGTVRMYDPYLYPMNQVEDVIIAINNALGNVPGEENLNSYLRDHGTAMTKTNTSGTTTKADLPLGLYIVAETDISAHDGIKPDGSA